MDRESAKEYILSHPTDVLRRDGSGKGYICPICGSGSGPKGTGITTKDGIHFTCWAGCFQSSDIIDIIGRQHGLDTFPEQLDKAAELYRLPIDPLKASSSSAYHNRDKTERHTDAQAPTHSSIHTPSAEAKAQTPADYAAFFKEAHSHIKETDYPQRRGLSAGVVERFMLGYVAEWRHPKAPEKVPTSPRLIIPTSRESYLARDTREDLTDDQREYSKSKVGKVHMFNLKALQQAERPIIIVEGEIDALAIMSVGGEAVALGSTVNVKALLKLLQTEKPAQPLILGLDNDQAGTKAADELARGLEQLALPFYRLNLYGSAKDAGEAILRDREALRQAVEESADIEEEAQQAEREKYLAGSAANYLQTFIDGISDSVNTPCISTGFPGVDAALDGGLYEGLYIVGAISSLGKTTLITQIADQIAQAGQDVIIISLEMARAELMAKSISRHTIMKVLEAEADTRQAKTARGITDGKRYLNYSRAERDLINESIAAYGEYAEHIYITEGVGNIGAEEIRQIVERHIKYTGHRPVCIVDYLQIMAPHSERATDKQATDHNVMELKRISRDCKVAMIAISSFNRDNYKTAVTMEAFKESGAVEYSSDVLIGLQLKGAGSKSFDATEEKRKNPRSVELIVLKNRNGSVGDKIDLQYYPMFNYFREAE